MRLEIEQADQKTEVELREGIFTFGGAPSDAVQLPGLGAGVLAVLIDEDRVVIEADEPLSFDGVFAPPHVRRLWLPGERLKLSAALSLRRLPDATPARADGTVAVVQDLFEGDEAAPAAAPRLLCLTGLDLGREFPLVDGVTEVGRGDSVGLRIRDRAVSRRHARIHHGEGKTVIEDLGTSNGIYVGGHKAKGPTELHDGDVIEIGRALLKFLGGTPRPEQALEIPVPPRSEAVMSIKTDSPEWLVTAGAVLLAVVGAIATWRMTG